MIFLITLFSICVVVFGWMVNQAFYEEVFHYEHPIISALLGIGVGAVIFAGFLLG